MKVNAETKKNGGMIEVLSVHECKGKGKSPLRAFATVRFNNLVAISGLMLKEFSNGEWKVDFPATRGKDKDGNDAYYPISWFDTGEKKSNAELYEELTKAVYEKFRNPIID